MREITDAVRVELLAIADRWVAKALSVERADRAAANLAIVAWYAGAGLVAPAIVWFDNPVQAALAYAAWPGDEPDELNEQTAMILLELGGDDQDAGIDESTKEIVRELVYNRVHGHVAGLIQNPITDTLASNVATAAARDEDVQAMARTVLSQYSAQRDVPNLRLHERSLLWGMALNGMSSVAVAEAYSALGRTSKSVKHLKHAVDEACFAVWPLRSVAFVCDRPTSIVGESGETIASKWTTHRLHNADGPALTWADGMELWAWHGQVVPSWVINNPTTDQIVAAPPEYQIAARQVLGIEPVPDAWKEKNAEAALDEALAAVDASLQGDRHHRTDALPCRKRDRHARMERSKSEPNRPLDHALTPEVTDEVKMALTPMPTSWYPLVLPRRDRPSRQFAVPDDKPIAGKLWLADATVHAGFNPTVASGVDRMNLPKDAFTLPDTRTAGEHLLLVMTRLERDDVFGAVPHVIDWWVAERGFGFALEAALWASRAEEKAVTDERWAAHRRDKERPPPAPDAMLASGNRTDLRMTTELFEVMAVRLRQHAMHVETAEWQQASDWVASAAERAAQDQGTAPHLLQAVVFPESSPVPDLGGWAVAVSDSSELPPWRRPTGSYSVGEARRFDARQMGGMLPTLLDLLGESLIPWLDEGISLPKEQYGNGTVAREVKEFATALFWMDSDSADEVLFKHRHHKQVGPLLAKATVRRPLDVLRRWQRHLGEPDVVDTVLLVFDDHPDAGVTWLDELDADERALVDARLVIDNAVDAGDEQIPGLLRRPRWTLDEPALRLPKRPGFLRLGRIARPLVADRSGALTPEATEHLVTMLMLGAEEPGADHRADLATVHKQLDSVTSAEFAWSLYRAWRVAGYPPKHSWMMRSLGRLGDDTTVRQLVPLILEWPSQRASKRATDGLDVLTAIGSDFALMELYVLSRTKTFKGLRAQAAGRVEQIATQRGLTEDELADRLVPTFGLNSRGELRIDLGARACRIVLDHELRPVVIDEDGNKGKSVPRRRNTDDPDLHDRAKTTLSNLRRDVRKIATDQVDHLERSMVYERRFSAEVFQEWFVEHPLRVCLTRRLVWGCFDGPTLLVSFRVAEDGSFADVEDNELLLPDQAAIGLAHPLHLGAETVAWSEVFSDYELGQPFSQLDREVMALPDPRSTLIALNDAPTTEGRILGLRRRGWKIDGSGGMRRDIDSDRFLTLTFSSNFAPQQVVADRAHTIDSLRTRSTGGTPSFTFGDVTPVLASEVMADIAFLHR